MIIPCKPGPGQMGDCTLGGVLKRFAFVLDTFRIRSKRGVGMDSLLPIVALAFPLEDIRSDTLPSGTKESVYVFVHTFQTVPAWNTPLVLQPRSVLKILATAPPEILNVLDPAARPGAPLGNQLPTTIRHQDNSSQFLNDSWVILK